MNDFIRSDAVQPGGQCGGLDDVAIRLVQVDEPSRLVVRLFAEAHYHEADLLCAHVALLRNDPPQLPNSDGELTTIINESERDCSNWPALPRPAKISTTSRGM